MDHVILVYGYVDIEKIRQLYTVKTQIYLLFGH